MPLTAIRIDDVEMLELASERDGGREGKGISSSMRYLAMAQTGIFPASDIVTWTNQRNVGYYLLHVIERKVPLRWRSLSYCSRRKEAFCCAPQDQQRTMKLGERLGPYAVRKAETYYQVSDTQGELAHQMDRVSRSRFGHTFCFFFSTRDYVTAIMAHCYRCLAVFIVCFLHL